MVERNVPREKLSRFFRSVSMMLVSGISLHDSLEHLTNDDSLIFGETVSDVAKKLAAGYTFSAALRTKPNIFPHVCADLVEAGEHSGSLHRTLEQLADHLSRSSNLERRFKAAMIYPIIIIALMLLMVLVMVWFVFPREKALLESLGAEMPLFTRVLFDWLGIVFHPIVIGLVSVLALAGIRFYTGGNEGDPKLGWRRLVDTNLLKLPLVGPLVSKMCSARALSVFATLLDAGATVDQSMESAAKLMGNVELEDRFKKAKNALMSGYMFSESLEHYEVFPTLAIHLFKVSEESGGMPRMSRQLSKIFEREVEQTIDTAASLVEPLALIFMGGFVGTILLATLLPTASIVSNL